MCIGVVTRDGVLVLPWSNMPGLASCKSNMRGDASCATIIVVINLQQYGLVVVQPGRPVVLAWAISIPLIVIVGALCHFHGCPVFCVHVVGDIFMFAFIFAIILGSMCVLLLWLSWSFMVLTN